uniref:Uncharacterized protein n=1 Tax=Oryza brachyantha TaxID=4533 RepID=J3N599_ORYBR
MFGNAGGGSENCAADGADMGNQRAVRGIVGADGHHLRAAGECHEHEDRTLVSAGGISQLRRGDLHDGVGRVPGQRRHPDRQALHGEPLGADAAAEDGRGAAAGGARLGVAAVLETWRLRSVRGGGNLSIAWQLPQFIILACSDVFCGIAQLEFFYSEAPVSMRSLCSAFSFLALSLGYYVNSFVVSMVALVTTAGGAKGWLPADLNDGHLDYYFWLWTGISAVNFVVYAAFAKNYTVKKVAVPLPHPH